MSGVPTSPDSAVANFHALKINMSGNLVSHNLLRLSIRACVVVILCSMATVSAHAKRLPPKPVAPVIADVIRYSAESDGTDSYVVATSEASGKVLWRKKVFHTRVHWWRGEEDNQWLFISDLKLAEHYLIVRDEKNRCYLVSPKTRRGNRRPRHDSFRPQTPRD